MAACKKDGDPSPDGKNGVSGNWQLTNIKISPAQNGVSDLVPIFNAAAQDECLTQGVYNFKSDKTIAITAPTNCGPTLQAAEEFVPVNNSSTWAIQDKKIIITTNGTALQADLTVNKTTMEWRDSAVDPDDGKTYTYTFVFKRV